MSVLDRITAPIVLPQRLLEAVDGMVEALAGLPAFERAVLERLDATDDRLEAAAENLAVVRDSARDLGESGSQLVSILSRTEAVVRDPIASDVAAMRVQLNQLTKQIERLEDRLPDPDAPGPIAKARDAITGAD